MFASVYVQLYIYIYTSILHLFLNSDALEMHKETPKFKETFNLQHGELQNKRTNIRKKRHDKY